MKRILDSAYESVVGDRLLPFYETRLRSRSTFRYRNEFEANQWRTSEEIAALQWGRLAALLQHAYATVEHYRSAFDACGLRPQDITTPADFARLPMLDKATVRKASGRLQSSAFAPASLIRSATGGSTGEPMQFCYDRDSYERRIAAAMRGDAWAGWRLCGEEFYLWGAPLLPERGPVRWKKQLHHAALRRAVVSSFDLTADKVVQVVRRYNRQGPRVVVGYANALYEFSRHVLQAGLRLNAPEGIISSAEKLHDYQRSTIEEAFGAPVFDRYGCREVMMIAAECERHDGLHVTADNLYVEVVRSGRPCGPGETGEILLTDLHNYGMPLIRYRVGDTGSWKGGGCACGRGLPLLDVVTGRVLDLISTPTGKVIAGEFFPHLLKDFRAIDGYQVIQESRDQLLIRLALGGPLSTTERALLESTVAQAVGPGMRIRWEVGQDVIIERGRKFRPVRSLVPVDIGGAGAEEEQGKAIGTTGGQE